MNQFFEHASWLYTRIYQNDYFFFDLWSIVHCWSGFFIYLLLKSFQVKKPFTLLVTILFCYELIEILFTYIALHIFLPETIKDQFTDIFIGMFGAGIGYFLVSFPSLHNYLHKRNLNLFVIFLASITYSYLWVGFYGYSYNTEYYNTPGINWFAFTFWFAGTFATIFTFNILKIKNVALKAATLWFLYLICLLLVEYFGYRIWELHENSTPLATPLVFGLIHGTPVLHFFYLFSPVFSISLFIAFRKLLYACLEVEAKRKKTAECLQFFDTTTESAACISGDRKVA